MEEAKTTGQEAGLTAAGVKRLTPEDTTIFEGTFSLLHCQVRDMGLFRGVFAVRLFPVRNPNRFISLHYTDTKEKEHEIGVIEDLSIFPEEAQTLVQNSLALHYHEKIIRRVNAVRSEYGLLFLDVETQQGPASFVMPWRGDRAEDYGEAGKVLLDSYDNRFIIPDVSKLPTADRRRFASYVYW